jgi:hypothetical protein
LEGFVNTHRICLIEWDGGWDMADSVDGAHALMERLGIPSDEYSISENKVDGQYIYVGGADGDAVSGGSFLAQS